MFLQCFIHLFSKNFKAVWKDTGQKTHLNRTVRTALELKHGKFKNANKPRFDYSPKAPSCLHPGIVEVFLFLKFASEHLWAKGKKKKKTTFYITCCGWEAWTLRWEGVTLQLIFTEIWRKKKNGFRVFLTNLLRHLNLLCARWRSVLNTPVTWAVRSPHQHGFIHTSDSARLAYRWICFPASALIPQRANLAEMDCHTHGGNENNNINRCEFTPRDCKQIYEYTFDLMPPVKKPALHQKAAGILFWGRLTSSCQGLYFCSCSTYMWLHQNIAHERTMQPVWSMSDAIKREHHKKNPLFFSFLGVNWILLCSSSL